MEVEICSPVMDVNIFDRAGWMEGRWTETASAAVPVASIVKLAVWTAVVLAAVPEATMPAVVAAAAVSRAAMMTAVVGAVVVALAASTKLLNLNTLLQCS